MSCTPDTSATTYADQTRSGGLVWNVPANASIGSPYTSTGYYGFGSLSDWLAGQSFAPVSAIPVGSTLTAASVTVRHRNTSTGTVTYPVLFTTIEVYLSGVLKQTIATTTPVPGTFTDQTYSLDLAAIGATVAQVNAGAITARICYQSGTVDPGTPDPTNPSDPTYNPALKTDRFAQQAQVMGAGTSGTGGTGGTATPVTPSTVDVEALSLMVCYDAPGGGGNILVAPLVRLPFPSVTVR